MYYYNVIILQLNTFVNKCFVEQTIENQIFLEYNLFNQVLVDNKGGLL